MPKSTSFTSRFVIDLAFDTMTIKAILRCPREPCDEETGPADDVETDSLPVWLQGRYSETNAAVLRQTDADGGGKNKVSEGTRERESQRKEGWVRVFRCVLNDLLACVFLSNLVTAGLLWGMNQIHRYPQTNADKPFALSFLCSLGAV